MIENKRFSVDNIIKTFHSNITDEKGEIITLEEYVDYLNKLYDKDTEWNQIKIDLNIAKDVISNQKKEIRKLKQFQKDTMDLIQSFKDRDLLPIERFLINNFEEELVEKTIENNDKRGKKNG